MSGTRLPEPLYEGEIISYSADAANGVRWLFQHNPSSTSLYKWECLSGPRLRQNTQTSQNPNSSYAYWSALGRITLPLAGDYDVSWGGTAQIDVTGNYDWYLALFNSTGTQLSQEFEGWAQSFQTGTSQYPKPRVAFERRFPGRPQGELLELRMKQPNNQGTFYTGYMSAEPVRCM